MRTLDFKFSFKLPEEGELDPFVGQLLQGAITEIFFGWNDNIEAIYQKWFHQGARIPTLSKDEQDFIWEMMVNAKIVATSVQCFNDISSSWWRATHE
jgi:hypothetical protein